MNLNTGRGTAGDAMGDTLKNIELVWGSKQDDIFIASSGVDIIHGDGGSDTVSYEASKHSVIVTLSDGQWTAAVVDDNDPLVAMDAMFDAADMDSDTPTADSVGTWRRGTAERPDAQVADELPTTKSYAEGDILASIENVTGSRQDDKIAGDGTPNVIKGGGGDDELVGGEVKMTMLHGGAGNDILGRRAEIMVDSDGVALTTGDVVTIAEIDDDLGDDTMYGDAGNDDLYGGMGNDTLVGGAGDDDLMGDEGADIFVFSPGNGSESDVILDLDVTSAAATATGDREHDRIDLSAFGIRAGDLDDIISERNGNAIINLEDYGGGRITIQGVDKATLGTSVDNDTNGDLEGFGTVDGASDGIFIL